MSYQQQCPAGAQREMISATAGGETIEIMELAAVVDDIAEATLVAETTQGDDDGCDGMENK